MCWRPRVAGGAEAARELILESSLHLSAHSDAAHDDHTDDDENEHHHHHDHRDGLGMFGCRTSVADGVPVSPFVMVMGLVSRENIVSTVPSSRAEAIAMRLTSAAVWMAAGDTFAVLHQHFLSDDGASLIDMVNTLHDAFPHHDDAHDDDGDGCVDVSASSRRRRGRRHHDDDDDVNDKILDAFRLQRHHHHHPQQLSIIVIMVIL